MRILTLFFLLLSARLLQAQPYYFKHYQVENSLSNNSVFCTTQDRSGFMWMGTKDGLNRFDGYSFKTYRHDPANEKSLGSDKVYSLLSDKPASLWVGTAQGLYHYNAVTEFFTLVKETKNRSVSVLTLDHEGNLWMLSSDKVYIYNTLQKKFSTVQLGQSFNPTYIYCRPNGEILVSSPRGSLARYDKTSRTFEILSLTGKKKNKAIGWISSIEETNDQQLIIGTTNQGIKLFDLKTNVLKDLIVMNKDKTHIFVRAIKKLNDQEYWIGTESGLYIYNHQSQKLVHLQKRNSNPYSLSDNAIYSLCRDTEGGMWAGTYFGGMNYYAVQSSIFTKYFPTQQENSISGNDIREICKDKNGNLWIGTEDAGLNKLTPGSGKFSSYFPDGSKQTIAHYNIHGLLADGDKLWIGTFEHGLDVMNINTGLITKHYHMRKGSLLRSDFILSLCKTTAGDLLIATTAGIYTYNSKKDDFDPVPGLPFLFFNTLKEDAEGTIWAGTFNDGLFNFKLGNSLYKNYRNDPKDTGSLPDNTVNCIFQDSKKNLWITTDGGGLSVLHKKTGRFKSYTVKNGMPANFLFNILEDDQHKLWISSTRGLVSFDPLKKTVKVYTKTDGLLTDQFNYSSAYKDTDGRMYFGSVKGLISFFPDQLNTNAKTAPLFLTGFKIDNTEAQPKKEDSVLQQSVLYTHHITLNNNQSSFNIDFAALSYFSPEKTEYAYKISGLYNNWQYLKTNRKIYFTKLAPGEYIFEAKAMIQGSNVWSKNNIKLFIVVLPPYWKSPLAWLIYTLLFIGLTALLIRQYHQTIQRKNNRRMEIFEHKKEKEIYQAKIEFFTNVAHEIRTPLTLIKGPMEKMIKSAGEVPALEKNLKIMERNTDRLLNLTNQLLDFRKTEINGFSLNFVKANISEILHDVNLQFMLAAEQKEIVYEISLPAEPVYAYIDLEAFYKIMSNLVDNAIKYGKHIVRVTLTANEQQDQFIVRVLNDGNKIKPELANQIFEPFFRTKEAEMKQGTGIGLSIAKSLAELHKGSLKLEETSTDYNILVATFPIHQMIEFNLKGKWKKI
ncbi:ligand-binding sensor domain-containing protein/signal transduction histidine kinase [Pedobacter cryoconitis]|uniref:histidine kinase n=1 Tax=Pedobacter cryoconitis TaxID=188932 RepID=A0A7W8YPU8_9SPHI|nr:two-component regulator propeller domain-containing protein [Pedobacter cryoconitis]MBB5619350.1 ligand-binding sensor domain-containing protein/signal transduction histidine kinase [Pedobacter cryoconitis]